MVTPEVQISPEVRTALGVDGAKRAASMYRAGLRCTICSRALPASGPVAVLVLRAKRDADISYTHPDCQPSAVLDVPAAVLESIIPAEADMAMTSFVAEQGGEPVAVLVAEMPGGVPLVASAQGDGPGEMTSGMAVALLGQGFTLITNVDQVPARVGGWRVAVSTGGPGLLHLEITSRRGELFYTGTATEVPGWTEAAERSPWCVLYGSAEPIDWPEQVTPAGTDKALAAAIATGGVFGARVPIVWQT